MPMVDLLGDVALQIGSIEGRLRGTIYWMLEQYNAPLRVNRGTIQLG